MSLANAPCYRAGAGAHTATTTKNTESSQRCDGAARKAKAKIYDRAATAAEWPTTRAGATRNRAIVQGVAARGRPAHADEQPRSGGGRATRRSGGLWRLRAGGAQLGLLRRHRALATVARRRRDAARAVGQARRHLPHPSRRATCADRQLESRAPLGQLGRVPPSGGARPHHVWPDDRWLVDLHRLAGHRSGDV